MRGQHVCDSSLPEFLFDAAEHALSHSAPDSCTTASGPDGVIPHQGESTRREWMYLYVCVIDRGERREGGRGVSLSQVGMDALWLSASLRRQPSLPGSTDDHDESEARCALSLCLSGRPPSKKANNAGTLV